MSALSIEKVLAEKDLLGSQLVKKNGELALLEEKNKLLQLTLDRGERQYGQRLDDLRLLRLEVNKLRQEKSLLAKGISSMTDLRLEVFQLERCLAQERMKSLALQEALQSPLNMHRWRKLSATHPDCLQLMDKVNILHKELLNKSQKLKESEKLHETLREHSGGQADTQLQEELRKNKKLLLAKENKIRRLTTELSMCRRQLEETAGQLSLVLRERGD